jgi:DNA-binding beta-propeller fold protein YncE
MKSGVQIAAYLVLIFHYPNDWRYYMKSILYLTALLSVLFGFSCQLYAADVEWKTLQTFSTESSPIDVAVPSNGQNMYVLSEGGMIHIYGHDGRVKGTIQVPPTTSGIEASPKGDTLFLRDKKNKTVQVIAVNFIVEISENGSPVKGLAEAPVQIAIYNDFQ